MIVNTVLTAICNKITHTYIYYAWRLRRWYLLILVDFVKQSGILLDIWPLSTKRTDVLPQDLVKSLSREIPVHDDVTKWKHFPRYWPFVPGIHRSPVNSHHKGQWRGALMFSLICAWINGWVNNHEAGDLRRHRAHYYVTIIYFCPDRYTGSSATEMLVKFQSDTIIITPDLAASKLHKI